MGRGGDGKGCGGNGEVGAGGGGEWKHGVWLGGAETLFRVSRFICCHYLLWKRGRGGRRGGEILLQTCKEPSLNGREIWACMQTRGKYVLRPRANWLFYFGGF